MQKHQNEAQEIARTFYNDIPHGHLFQSTPGFFKPYHFVKKPVIPEAPKLPRTISTLARLNKPMEILNTDWTSKRQWLSTHPYFQHDPTRLEGIINWSHPAQQPYPHDDLQWHSLYKLRANYTSYECHVCRLIGHISWSCLAYKCKYC